MWRNSCDIDKHHMQLQLSKKMQHLIAGYTDFKLTMLHFILDSNLKAIVLYYEKLHGVFVSVSKW